MTNYIVTGVAYTRTNANEAPIFHRINEAVCARNNINAEIKALDDLSHYFEYGWVIGDDLNPVVEEQEGQ